MNANYWGFFTSVLLLSNKKVNRIPRRLRKKRQTYRRLSLALGSPAVSPLQDALPLLSEEKEPQGRREKYQHWQHRRCRLSSCGLAGISGCSTVKPCNYARACCACSTACFPTHSSCKRQDNWSFRAAPPRINAPSLGKNENHTYVPFYSFSTNCIPVVVLYVQPMKKTGPGGLLL